MAQVRLTNVNKSAGRITGLYSSISASFWFTCQSIHCIARPVCASASLLAWRVNRSEHLVITNSSAAATRSEIALSFAIDSDLNIFSARQ